MQIGYIGTGNIGEPMAASILKAGFQLVVHDIAECNTQRLLDQGAQWSNSPAEIAANCDIIFSCLPGPVEMEAVVFGPNGILEGIRRGAAYIDQTTNSPELVQRVHGLLKERGADMLDAPVSGGREGALIRDLLVVVGGEEAVFERCRPLLEAIGERVYHAGGIGAGCICKIAHNTAVFCTDMAMAECWTLAVKAGVAPEVIVDIFRNAALGRMSNLNMRLPDTYFRGDFEPRFALKIARKDLGLANEMARAHNVPMRIAQLCEQEYMEAMGRGWEGRDSSIVLTLQEERAGVQVRL
ncbi:MAG TPA: NAD(P)-dependent oxidoreductase [Alphaproteobacteria bacterium]|nr:NAD(P)-dependent oxidoreductase [Alphaproteobacteria bacterium]